MRIPRPSRGGSLSFLATVALGVVTFLPVAAEEGQGWSYQFHWTWRDDLQESEIRGKVITDGSQYYVALEPREEPRDAHAMLFAVGQEAELQLNLKNSTYHRMASSEFPLYTVLPAPLEAMTFKRPAVEVTEGAGETLLGYSTHKVEVRLQYWLEAKIFTETVKASTDIVHVYWLTDALSLPTPEAYRPIQAVRVPKVDALLAQEDPPFQGFLLRSRHTIITKIQDGATTEEVATYEVTTLNRATAPANTFVLPENFRYQEPEGVVFGGGRTGR